MNRRSYSGSCHCGRVRFAITSDLGRIEDCNCSMCSKKGFLHLIVPPEDFQLLAGADALSTYQFGSGLAKHTFCGTCGVHPFYVPRSDPDKIDVNVRCLEGIELEQLQIVGFDGRNWENAMQVRPPA